MSADAVEIEPLSFAPLTLERTALREVTQMVMKPVGPVQLPYGVPLQGEVKKFDNVKGTGIIRSIDIAHTYILGRLFHVRHEGIVRSTTDIRPPSLRENEKVTFQIGGDAGDGAELAIHVVTKNENEIYLPEDLPVKTKMRGQCVWFGPGPIGFLKCVDERFPVCFGREFFMHYSAIKSNGYKTVSEGQHVEFDLVFDDGKASWKCNAKGCCSKTPCGKKNPPHARLCLKCESPKPANRFKCDEVTGPDGACLSGTKPPKSCKNAAKGPSNYGLEAGRAAHPLTELHPNNSAQTSHSGRYNSAQTSHSGRYNSAQTPKQRTFPGRFFSGRTHGQQLYMEQRHSGRPSFVNKIGAGFLPLPGYQPTIKLPEFVRQRYHAALPAAGLLSPTGLRPGATARPAPRAVPLQHLPKNFR